MELDVGAYYIARDGQHVRIVDKHREKIEGQFTGKIIYTGDNTIEYYSDGNCFKSKTDKYDLMSEIINEKIQMYYTTEVKEALDGSTISIGKFDG